MLPAVFWSFLVGRLPGSGDGVGEVIVVWEGKAAEIAAFPSQTTITGWVEDVQDEVWLTWGGCCCKSCGSPEIGAALFGDERQELVELFVGVEHVIGGEILDGPYGRYPLLPDELLDRNRSSRLMRRPEVWATHIHAWLRDHLVDLQYRYTHELPNGLPECVVHGDAWVGNVVSTQDGKVMFLDLERCSIGPPEWDLVHTAIKNTSFGWFTAADYRDFCRHYGHDVTDWTGFTLLRDIRELRMTCYVAQHAAEHPGTHTEAQLRLDSLRGENGPRPWNWTPAL